ncbi:MAG: hypothetical protein J7K88_11365 [Candidatus Fermentibacteraceae bacterium]|nr:hypothetical protein [Candidatus Fermentibacteraceae bacterium]
MENSGEKLGEVFSFSGEDLNANNAGFLTPVQERMLSRYINSEGCATRVASISIAMTVLVFLAVFFLGVDTNSRGFRMALPYYLGTFGVFVFVFLLFVLISRLRRRDIRDGRISTVEGQVSVWKKSYEHGTGYFASVGGIRFRLYTREQMQALQEQSFCRVNYIKHPPMHLILSIQPTG